MANKYYKLVGSWSGDVYADNVSRDKAEKKRDEIIVLSLEDQNWRRRKDEFGIVPTGWQFRRSAMAGDWFWMAPSREASHEH